MQAPQASNRLRSFKNARIPGKGKSVVDPFQSESVPT
jgi:hypothetical protein